MRLTPTFRTLLLLWLLAVASAAAPRITGAARNPGAQDGPNVEWEFHTRLPLGYEPLELMPSKENVVLFASAETPQWDGWRRLMQGGSRVVLNRDGTEMRAFPRSMDFRVTASARELHSALLESLSELDTTAPLNDFLRDLHFQLLIYHDLEITRLDPSTVKAIGVPDDVPYDERIYHLSFELPETPLTDRLVLEVLAPDGSRVCRFHLEIK